MFFHPDLLPESADPCGSSRHYCTIVYEQIHGQVNTTFYDDIDNNGIFIIEEYNPKYDGYEVHIFSGTVLREQDGRYSWWHNLTNKGEY